MDTAFADGPSATISSALLSEIAGRMGFDPSVPNDLGGLSCVYAAWCRSMPFDNIRKMIALAAGEKPLPGLNAAEYFESWLDDGAGGTCWPSSNALWALLRRLGFEARRVGGSMYDTGAINHGTVKVRIDKKDWLVDTSMFTIDPLAIGRGVHVTSTAEVEFDGDSHVVWADFAPSAVFLPCRLLVDQADDDLYAERYERYSREYSPFNTRLYFREGGPDGTSLILGNTRFHRTADGLAAREFSPHDLCSYLEGRGISERLIELWVEKGGLAASMDPANVRLAPEVLNEKPSLRMNGSIA